MARSPTSEAATEPTTDDVLARLERIEGRQEDVHRLVRRVDDRLQSLDRSCSRMDGHISFVEHVYDSIRHPFQFLGLPTRVRALRRDEKKRLL